MFDICVGCWVSHLTVLYLFVCLLHWLLLSQVKLSCALPDCLFVWLIAGHEPCCPTYWLSYLHSWFMLVWGPSHSLEKLLPFWAPDVNNKNSLWNFSFKIRYTEGIINIFNHAFLKLKGEFWEAEGPWPTCCFKGGGRERMPKNLSCDWSMWISLVIFVVLPLVRIHWGLAGGQVLQYSIHFICTAL